MSRSLHVSTESTTVEYAKTLEITEDQAASLEKQIVSRIRRHDGERLHKNRKGTAKRQDRVQRNKTKGSICGCCGSTYPHPGEREACPSYKKECRNCGKTWHFQPVYRSKKQQQRERRPHRKVNTLRNDDSNDDNTFRRTAEPALPLSGERETDVSLMLTKRIPACGNLLLIISSFSFVSQGV